MTVRAEAPAVAFSRTTVEPGFFIQVRVKAAPRAKVILTFLDRTKELYPKVSPGFLGVKTVLRSVLKPVRQLCRFKTQVDFEGLIATSCTVSPGQYLCKVEIWDGGRLRLYEQVITVVYCYFASDRIRVTKQMWQDSLAPGKKKADRLLNQVIVERAVQKQVGSLWNGKFIWPFPGRLTTSYGVKRYVNNIENGRHSGWDLAGATGTPVRAINRGRVVFAGMMHATGNTVIIHHGLDLFSLYAHLSQISVREGQMLSKGERLGAVGSTGLSTAPHLHLTVKVGDVPVNPLLVLDQKLSWGK